MSRANLRMYSLLSVILATAQLLNAQASHGTTKPSNKVPRVVYVETSVKSWTDGYASWIAARPDVVLALEKGSGGRINLKTPFLDYFASDGKSLYSNSSAAANIDFLRKLPQSGQKKSGSESDELQPTVGDFLGMFSKLNPYKAQILAHKSPVLLAVCKNDTPSCVDQNQALKEFKGRAATLGVQVVEVKLFTNPPGE
jgi:hypothetical protein